MPFQEWLVVSDRANHRSLQGKAGQISGSNHYFDVFFLVMASEAAGKKFGRLTSSQARKSLHLIASPHCTARFGTIRSLSDICVR